MTEKVEVDIEQIKKYLPHRAPFLFVERLTDIVPEESATGWKAVAYNEPHFLGHFPEQAVMPGVLIVESMAQTSAALVFETLPPGKGLPLVYFMSIDNAKFRRPVVPGDQLRIHVVKDRRRGNVWRFNCVARVEGVAVAEASVTAMIIENNTASE